MVKLERSDFDYGIRSTWQGYFESPASIGEKFIHTLDALSRLDPIFANWQVMDRHRKSFVSRAEAQARIAAITEGNVTRDDFGEPDPVYGYHATATTDGFGNARRATLRVDAGGTRYCGTRLEFGEWKVPPDPAILTFPLFKAALLAVNTIWLAPWACAYAFRVDYFETPLSPGAPLFPYSLFHIPWIAYLSAPLIVRLSLPADIFTERAADGGLLLSATQEQLDPTNPEHLRRARILAEILMKRTGHSSSIPAGIVMLSDDK
jgi:hypothetical protein